MEHKETSAQERWTCIEEREFELKLDDSTWDSMRPWLIEGPVMKPCHENNGAAIYVERTATVRNILF